MKASKCPAPAFFLLLVLISCGCANSDRSQIHTVISAELDPLKNMSNETTVDFIPSADSFSDADSQELLQQIRKISPMFFKDFDYSVKNIRINSKTGTALADLELTTIDAAALARDFYIRTLKTAITARADGMADTLDTALTLRQRYQLLEDLLIENDYETVKSPCTVTLIKKQDNWILMRTRALENALSGGQMSRMSDPDVLPATDTVAVFLDTLKNLSSEELAYYLKLDAMLSQDIDTSGSIVAALLDQVENHLDYEILDTIISGYRAEVTVAITSYDAEAILSAYQKEMNEYLNTPEAVIAGEEVRRSHAHSLLLSAIRGNTASHVSNLTLHLTNDGVGWILDEDNDEEELGEALFGSFIHS